MKKVILAVAVVGTMLAGQANAHEGFHGGFHEYRGYEGYRGYRNEWVAPAVAGMVVGAVIGSTVNQPVYSQPVYQVPCVQAYDQNGRYLGCIRQ